MSAIKKSVILFIMVILPNVSIFPLKGAFMGLFRGDSLKVLSWCGYDVGNSGFATTIMAAIYPVYFREVAALGLAPNLPMAYWAYASALSLFLSAFFAPILGATADLKGSKKKMLGLFTALGAIFAVTRASALSAPVRLFQICRYWIAPLPPSEERNGRPTEA